jgi:hypothetical protein
MSLRDAGAGQDKLSENGIDVSVWTTTPCLNIVPEY